MSDQIIIVKSNGERSSFSEKKLRRSLKKSGANNKEQNEILYEIKKNLYDGIRTKELYDMALRLLKKIPKAGAARYKLKRAIIELGPSGFPFEKFISAILAASGYKTKINQIIKGRCIHHEIDVIAEKDEKHFMIECKFHNKPSYTCDVKVPLYFHSRFMDIESTLKEITDHDNKFHQGWVVTNTRFTSDAIQYGECAGLRLIGWDYPKKGSLNNLIDQTGLHPLTSLTSLTLYEKQRLLDSGIVLCSDLCENPQLLRNNLVKENRINKVLLEAEDLCRY